MMQNATDQVSRARPHGRSRPARPLALFRELDAKVREAMGRYAIPGVDVGVLYRGHEYVQGYG